MGYWTQEGARKAAQKGAIRRKGDTTSRKATTSPTIIIGKEGEIKTQTKTKTGFETKTVSSKASKDYTIIKKPDGSYVVRTGTGKESIDTPISKEVGEKAFETAKEHKITAGTPGASEAFRKTKQYREQVRQQQLQERWQRSPPTAEEIREKGTKYTAEQAIEKTQGIADYPILVYKGHYIKDEPWIEYQYRHLKENWADIQFDVLKKQAKQQELKEKGQVQALKSIGTTYGAGVALEQWQKTKKSTTYKKAQTEVIQPTTTFFKKLDESVAKYTMPAYNWLDEKQYQAIDLFVKKGGRYEGAEEVGYTKRSTHVSWLLKQAGASKEAVIITRETQRALAKEPFERPVTSLATFAASFGAGYGVKALSSTYKGVATGLKVVGILGGATFIAGTTAGTIAQPTPEEKGQYLGRKLAQAGIIIAGASLGAAAYKPSSKVVAKGTITKSPKQEPTVTRTEFKVGKVKGQQLTVSSKQGSLSVTTTSKGEVALSKLTGKTITTQVYKTLPSGKWKLLRTYKTTAPTSPTMQKTTVAQWGDKYIQQTITPERTMAAYSKGSAVRYTFDQSTTVGKVLKTYKGGIDVQTMTKLQAKGYPQIEARVTKNVFATYDKSVGWSLKPQTTQVSYQVKPVKFVLEKVDTPKSFVFGSEKVGGEYVYTRVKPVIQAQVSQTYTAATGRFTYTETPKKFQFPKFNKKAQVSLAGQELKQYPYTDVQLSIPTVTPQPVSVGFYPNVVKAVSAVKTSLFFPFVPMSDTISITTQIPKMIQEPIPIRKVFEDTMQVPEEITTPAQVTTQIQVPKQVPKEVQIPEQIVNQIQVPVQVPIQIQVPEPVSPVETPPIVPVFVPPIIPPPVVPTFFGDSWDTGGFYEEPKKRKRKKKRKYKYTPSLAGITWGIKQTRQQKKMAELTGILPRGL